MDGQRLVEELGAPVIMVLPIGCISQTADDIPFQSKEILFLCQRTGALQVINSQVEVQCGPPRQKQCPRFNFSGSRGLGDLNGGLNIAECAFVIPQEPLIGRPPEPDFRPGCLREVRIKRFQSDQVFVLLLAQSLQIEYPLPHQQELSFLFDVAGAEKGQGHFDEVEGFDAGKAFQRLFACQRGVMDGFFRFAGSVVMLRKRGRVAFHLPAIQVFHHPGDLEVH